jgi:sugar lactone lactonase YvrE
VQWKCGASDGQVVAGGNGRGNKMNQFSRLIDVIVDKERNNLLICDLDNRRVMRWPLRNGTSGQTIISNIDCSKLIMDNNGYLYVSDYQKHEVRRWKVGDTNGTLVAGGNGKGDHLNQLNNPTFIFIDDDHSVYVSDYDNHRVMKWMKDEKAGIVVAGGHGEGNNLTQLSGPQGLIVDHLGAVYVADCCNHRIMRWCQGARQGDIVVGGNGEGEKANQLRYPFGLSSDREGNLYIADRDNHRIQKFHIDGS